MIDRKRLADQLVIHEGCKLSAYQDSLGYWTIGIGRLIDERKGGGITTEEAFYLLSRDIDRALEDARKLPFFEQLSAVRQNAIVELVFSMGLPTLKEFRRMLAALTARNYDKAAVELKDSKWAGQVGPTRSGRLIRMIQEGVWPQ